MFCMKIKPKVFWFFFKHQTLLVPNKAFCFQAPNSSKYMESLISEENSSQRIKVVVMAKSCFIFLIKFQKLFWWKIPNQFCCGFTGSLGSKLLCIVYNLQSEHFNRYISSQHLASTISAFLRCHFPSSK